jgi:hypothetical protein
LLTRLPAQEPGVPVGIDLADGEEHVGGLVRVVRDTGIQHRLDLGPRVGEVGLRARPAGGPGHLYQAFALKRICSSNDTSLAGAKSTRDERLATETDL